MVCEHCGGTFERIQGNHAQACPSGRFRRSGVTASHREYLAAFDRVLAARAPTEAVAARQAMGAWLDVVLAEAGVTPEDAGADTDRDRALA